MALFRFPQRIVLFRAASVILSSALVYAVVHTLDEFGHIISPPVIAYRPIPALSVRATDSNVSLWNTYNRDGWPTSGKPKSATDSTLISRTTKSSTLLKRDSKIPKKSKASDVSSLLKQGSEIPKKSKASYERNKDLLSYTKPRNVPKYSGAWQRVNNSATVYVFSAFYDDRLRADSSRHPMIRTIAVSRLNARGGLLCLLWFPDTPRPSVTTVDSSTAGAPFNSRSGEPFRAVILSCAASPASRGIPEHVSIVTSSDDRVPTTLLRVQVPAKPEHPIAFGHCMSVAYGHQDPYRIVEWMELHRMWGVGEVTVYNYSLHEAPSRVYSHYGKKGFVDFRQSPSASNSHGDDSDMNEILLDMSPALNDCMYRNLYRYRRLVVTDIDEMIVPRMHDNYTAMLTAIDALQTAEKMRSLSYLGIKNISGFIIPTNSYMFNNVYFFSDLNATSRAPWFLATQQYVRHVNPSPKGYSAKSILNPRSCVALQNHYCWQMHSSSVGGKWNLNVPQSLGTNQHYKECHFDEYLQEPGHCARLMKQATVDNTMARFRRELESRVVGVLTELDLVEPV